MQIADWADRGSGGVGGLAANGSAKVMIAALVALWGCGIVAGLAMQDLASVGILIALPAGVIGLFLVWQMLESRSLATTVLFCVAVFLVDATFRFRDYTDKSIDAQILIRIGSWVLAMVVALWNLPRNLSAVLTPVYLMWTAVYAWALITTSWAYSPSYSAVAVISLIAFHLFTLHITANYEETSIIRMVVFVATLVSLLSILVYIFLPAFGRMWEFVGNVKQPINRMRGITASANTIGAISGVGLLLIGLYWRELTARTYVWVAAAIGICVVAMLLSQNRSSIVTLMGLIFAYYCLRPRNIPWAILIVAVVAIVLTLVVPFAQDALGLLARSGKADEITSGTNRGVIWARVILLWQQREILGYGYGSMLFILPKQSGLFSVAAHAHNMFLESLVSTGLIGFTIFMSSVVTTIYTAVRCRATRPMCLLFFILCRGMFEAMPFNGVASFSAAAMALSVAFVAVASLDSRKALARHQAARAAAFARPRFAPA